MNIVYNVSMKIIETIEKWKVAEAYFREHDYRFWQSQYSWDMDEGFHAWFFNGQKDVEVVTHNEEIQRMIIAFNAQG